MVNCTSSPACSTTVEYVGYMYFFTTIAFAGILLNILNLVVLTRTPVKMNQSTKMFLTALAGADLGGLVLVGPIAISRCLAPTHDWEVPARSYYESLVFLPFANAFASTSVYLTVVVSIERYVCVKYTAFNKRLNRRRVSRACIGCCVAAAVAMNAPYVFFSVVDGDGRMVRTEFGDGPQFQYYLWARLAINKILPIIIVAIANALLVSTVVGTTRQSKTLLFPNNAQSRRQRQQTRLTIMMMSISIVFLVCHCMEPITHKGVYRSLFGACSTYTPTYRTVTMVTNTLETLSYSTNFIFYCIFHRQFSAGLRQIFCRCFLQGSLLPKTSSFGVLDASCQTDNKQLVLERTSPDNRSASRSNTSPATSDSPPGKQSRSNIPNSPDSPGRQKEAGGHGKQTVPDSPGRHPRSDSPGMIDLDSPTQTVL